MLIGNLGVFLNIWNVVRSNLMSWSNNSVISGSVSIDSLSVSGCEFQPLCLSGHLLLDASCCDFYPVGYWIFLTSVLGHISLFGGS